MLPLKPIIHIGNPCFQATLEALSDPAFESFLLPSAEKVLKTGEAIETVEVFTVKHAESCINHWLVRLLVRKYYLFFIAL